MGMEVYLVASERLGILIKLHGVYESFDDASIEVLKLHKEDTRFDPSRYFVVTKEVIPAK